MDRVKLIGKIENIKEFIFLHKESIKKAILPITVAIALLFFWISGNTDGNIIEEDATASAQNSVTDEGLDESMVEKVELYDIYVDIGGCVYEPGVYKIQNGTRLFEVIDMAGGLTPEADINSINRAEEVYDGQKIIIYSKVDVSNGTYGSDYSSLGGMTSSGKININTADLSTLQEIPGVGPSTAQKIIDYRTTSGRFMAIEDIKNVSGIGDKTFEKMKAYITV